MTCSQWVNEKKSCCIRLLQIIVTSVQYSMIIAPCIVVYDLKKRLKDFLAQAARWLIQRKTIFILHLRFFPKTWIISVVSYLELWDVPSLSDAPKLRVVEHTGDGAGTRPRCPGSDSRAAPPPPPPLAGGGSDWWRLSVGAHCSDTLHPAPTWPVWRWRPLRKAVSSQ